MLALRLGPSQLFSLAWISGRPCHPRWLHDPKGGWARWEGAPLPQRREPEQQERQTQDIVYSDFKHRGINYHEQKHQELKSQDSQKHDSKHYQSRHQGLSLFEELFPEEVKRPSDLDRQSSVLDQQIPRLPPPDLDDVDEQENLRDDRNRSGKLTKAASKAALRRWDIAILVMQRASKSLDESDFRRIAPKGQHIEDWKGPGDPLKVIPGRDQATLQPLGHYFLLFPNPAYARAYQNHVVHTHRLATTHTPSSLQSPMAPPAGMLIEGEDVDTLLQDYALCPPSQTLSLKVLFPPYSTGVQRLVNGRGYIQLVKPVEKAGRAVLFWVIGHQPQINIVRDAIAQDGRDRGMEWALLNGRKSIEKIDGSTSLADLDELQEFRSEESEGDEGPGSVKRTYPRWIITFEDEHEARRFVRAWHRRPFLVSRDPSLQDEPPYLVHAEYIW